MKLKPWNKRITIALLCCYSLLTVIMSGLVTDHAFMDMHKHDHEKQHFSIACNWACTAALGSVSADITIPADISPAYDKFEFSIQEVLSHISIYSISNRSPPLFT